jgi:hypothetical protein
MDLCLRTILHRNLQCTPFLLRHLLPLQRRRQALQPIIRLLAVLAVLP